MYLKQIEISGFKSFAAPTVLSFEGTKDTNGLPGITAIVGPNGSGKSNVSDAIRWVMGEQSMKNLRGKKSEDVIFAGSESKGKLSSARVALVFDNTDKKIPVEYDEVVVERKMYRDGEGEYFINGARVRLMDVIDILAQAGMGKGSHCVVGQGMTDAILGATPAQRRLMIEDAAGVKHYQIRKVRSEKKLDKTKENLARTRELIAEVVPHLKNLRKQSEKAARSKEVHDELKALQRQYYAYVWHHFEDERIAIDNKKQESGIALKTAQRGLDKIVELISVEAKKVEDGNIVGEHEEAKNAHYADLRKVDQAIAIAKGRIEVEKEHKITEQKVKSIPVDLIYVREQLQAIQEKQDGFITLLDEIKTIEELEKLKKSLHTIQKDLQTLHKQAGKKTVNLPLTVNKEKMAQIDAAITKNEQIILESEGKRKQLEEAIAQIDEKIREGVSKDRQAREQFFVLEKQQRESQQALDAVREKYNESKIELARLEVREEDVTHEALQELGVEITTLDYDNQSVDVPDTELKIARLKSEYERIGGIDPLVVEEFNETQERYDFLTKESNDLEKAMTSLKEVIKEMDKKIHSAFVKAYKEINVEFTKYFRILFAGGNARLKQVSIDLSPKKETSGDDAQATEEALEEVEEDEITKSRGGSHKTEIGIEIEASPPGKKVKQLTLLSGGERSLTSIAMLFAIIAYNPPPFAVLDEVEAALDEANSRRLAKIFAELSGQTQFVIITHNRETMRHADMLYGVTMSGDGASQILSVKLDQLKENGEVK